MKHRTSYRLTKIPEVAYIIPAPAKNGCRVWRPETVKGAPAPRPYTGAFFMPETDVSVMAVCVGNSTELPGTFDLGSPTPRASSPDFGESCGDVSSTLSKGQAMTQSIQVAPATFTFQSQAIRTTVENGELWFNAKDVCDILGYTNSRKAIADHCKEKGVTNRYTPTSSGNQEMVYINEPNLYRLIIKSRKPEAEAFEAWVMEEVLPTIRKTGSYESKARPSKTRKALPGGLTLEQQDSIKALHRELVKAAPKDLQGKLAIRLWSAVKSKYGVTYKEVPPTEYAEILSLMARTAQEMPLLVEEKPAHIAVMDFDTRRDGEWRVYIRDGKAYRLAVMYATAQGDPYAPH